MAEKNNTVITFSVEDVEDVPALLEAGLSVFGSLAVHRVFWASLWHSMGGSLPLYLEEEVGGDTLTVEEAANLLLDESVPPGERVLDSLGRAEHPLPGVLRDFGAEYVQLETPAGVRVHLSPAAPGGVISFPRESNFAAFSVAARLAEYDRRVGITISGHAPEIPWKVQGQDE